MDTIKKPCLKSRITGSTSMNEYSSYSHCIFIITLIKQDSKFGIKYKGKLYLVGLAWSEKTSKINATGLNLEEA